MTEREEKPVRRVPLNSSQTDDPMAYLDLINSFEGNLPNILIEMKAQISFIESGTLPASMRDDTRRALEKAGVIFEDMVPNDPLFVFATLPEGWKREKTGKRIISGIFDGKSRLRAVATFKDSIESGSRHAYLTAVRRFGFEIDKKTLEKTGLVVVMIKDAGLEIARTDPLPVASSGSRKNAEELAINWLNEEYPDWQDPAAYWDDDKQNPVSPS